MRKYLEFNLLKRNFCFIILSALLRKELAVDGKKVPICEVCKEPETHGAHKHRYAYCEVCKKRTEHVTAFFGAPWHCSESHFEKGRCSQCGKKLPKNAAKIAKALGAKVYCKECSRPVRWR